MSDSDQPGLPHQPRCHGDSSHHRTDGGRQTAHCGGDRPLSGQPYYVAHNAAFDRGVLPEMNGARIRTSAGARCIRTSSTAPVSALRVESGRAAVGQTPRWYPHRALYDRCYVTAAPLQRITGDLAGRRSKWCRSSTAGAAEEVLFGKHRG